MGDLHTAVRVACPLASAEIHVRAYLVKHATERGAESESAQFNLRLGAETLLGLGLAAEDRGVHVVLRLIRDRDTTLPHYKVRWTPERKGTHTLFFGELALEDGAHAGTEFGMRIDGRYEATAIKGAHANDPAYAERLATATASELLAQIETFVLIEVEAERTRGGRRTNGVSHGVVG